MTLASASKAEPGTEGGPRLWARQEGPWVPRRRHVVLGLILVALAIAATAFVVLRAQETRYEATIEQIVPWGSSQLFVAIQVKNLGGAAETPTCRLIMNSPAYTFSGTSTLIAHRAIRAGSTATYDVIVPVTDEGATHIAFNTSNVDCR